MRRIFPARFAVCPRPRGANLLVFFSLLFIGKLSRAEPGPEDYCSRLKRESLAGRLKEDSCGVVRGPLAKKQLALVFTGGAYADSYPKIRAALTRVGAKGSFFLTGSFARNPRFAPFVRDMLAHGDYVGPHSDSHYQPVTDFRETVIGHDFFAGDLRRNLDSLAALGVKREAIRYWILPNEDFNGELALWSHAEGLRLFNFTTGTRTNADYTGENDANFVSNDQIFRSVLDRDELNTTGLNGFLLLFHLGVGTERHDPFANRLGELLQALKERGYTFARIDDLLDPAIGGSQP